MLGSHGDVGLELADPPAARLLELEQARDSRVEGPVEGGGGGDAQLVLLSGAFRDDPRVTSASADATLEAGGGMGASL
jgi:hypothetical protein